MNDAGISSRLTQHVSHFIFISWYISQILEMLTEFLHFKPIYKKYLHIFRTYNPFLFHFFSFYLFTLCPERNL